MSCPQNLLVAKAGNPTAGDTEVADGVVNQTCCSSSEKNDAADPQRRHEQAPKHSVSDIYQECDRNSDPYRKHQSDHDGKNPPTDTDWLARQRIRPIAQSNPAT